MCVVFKFFVDALKFKACKMFSAHIWLIENNAHKIRNAYSVLTVQFSSECKQQSTKDIEVSEIELLNFGLNRFDKMRLHMRSK